MSRNRRSESVTRVLSGASYSLVATSRKKIFRPILVLIITAIFLGGILYFKAIGSAEIFLLKQVELLKTENSRLIENLKQQAMIFQHEQATRQSLERQLADQSDELKKAKKDLSFYRGNSSAQVK